MTTKGNGNETFDTYNMCTSVVGASANYGVYAKAVCAENTPSLEMQCVSIWGKWADGNDTWSNITCPASYPIMTSCQGISRITNMNLVMIDDNNGCDCHKDGANGIAAVGIWYARQLF